VGFPVSNGRRVVPSGRFFCRPAASFVIIYACRWWFLPRDALQCKARYCYHMSCVHLSVILVDHDHIGWKSWKLIAWTISPTSSLFLAQRSSTYSQGNMEKFWGGNVRSTPTSITSGWIESTKSHVILGGGVVLWQFVYFCSRIVRSSLRLHSFLVLSVHAEFQVSSWHWRQFNHHCIAGEWYESHGSSLANEML